MFQAIIIIEEYHNAHKSLAARTQWFDLHIMTATSLKDKHLEVRTKDTNITQNTL